MAIGHPPKGGEDRPGEFSGGNEAKIFPQKQSKGKEKNEEGLKFASGGQ